MANFKFSRPSLKALWLNKEKKKEIEPFDVIYVNSYPNSFFRSNKKKIRFSACRPILDIFGFTLLK